MNYCEKCSCATEDVHCPLCGTKKLRPVREDDYCFLTECEKSYAAERKRVLAAEGIEAVGAPYGNGFLTQVALPLENERLYVRFPDLERAVELLKQERNERDDAYLSYVRSRTDDLFVSTKLAKNYAESCTLQRTSLSPSSPARSLPPTRSLTAAASAWRKRVCTCAVRSALSSWSIRIPSRCSP